MQLFYKWSEHASTMLSMPTWTIENSKQHTWYHCDMVYLEWRYHNTWTFVWCSSLKVCCRSFWIFLLVAKGPVFVSLLLQHDCCEWPQEWKLHFARKCLRRKWGIMHRKTNQALQLAHFFKMQKLIGCDTTTRKCQLLTDSLPPLNVHAQARK